MVGIVVLPDDAPTEIAEAAGCQRVFLIADARLATLAKVPFRGHIVSRALQDVVMWS